MPGSGFADLSTPLQQLRFGRCRSNLRGNRFVRMLKIGYNCCYNTASKRANQIDPKVSKPSFS